MAGIADKTARRAEILRIEARGGKPLTLNAEAVKRQLRIPEDQDIPQPLLDRLLEAEPGDTVRFRGRTIRVTPLLARRVEAAFGREGAGE